MTRANLKKVITSQLLLPQHQSTYPRSPESASIEIPFQTQIYLLKLLLNVNILKQILIHKKTGFKNFIKQGLKGGTLIDDDSGPLR